MQSQTSKMLPAHSHRTSSSISSILRTKLQLQTLLQAQTHPQ
jgi:hypothetical protein